MDILDAMSSHYGDPIDHILARWSWKLFCARWRRLIDYTANEREKREKEEREREFKERQRETESAHQANMTGQGQGWGQAW